MSWGQDINWVKLSDIPENAHDNVLVFWTADWCGPCKKFRKVLNNNADLINENYYAVKFIVNKEWDNVIGDINSLPTMRIFDMKDGEFIYLEEFEGAYDDENTKIILNHYKGE
jgi:thiol-disulfide isomerase/thioredoxin